MEPQTDLAFWSLQFLSQLFSSGKSFCTTSTLLSYLMKSIRGSLGAPDRLFLMFPNIAGKILVHSFQTEPERCFCEFSKHIDFIKLFDEIYPRFPRKPGEMFSNVPKNNRIKVPKNSRIYLLSSSPKTPDGCQQ